MSFSELLKKDDFILLTEVDPPKGADLSAFMDTALGIKGRVGGVVVTDGAQAIMRMTPLAPCRMLIERNMDPLMILNGRDRNRISFQGDLLAAWALGVRNVLLKPGQDPAAGDQPLARPCGDLNLEEMLQSIVGLNAGRDLAGESLEGTTGYNVGTFLEVSDDVKVNRIRAESISRLAELGASFVVLGPTYDMNIIDLFLRKAEDVQIKVFASIMFLKSVAMIRYLNNLPEVPSIPHEFLKQMIDAPLKQKASLEIAANFLADVEERCQGAVLIALGWGTRLPEFLDMIGR